MMHVLRAPIAAGMLLSFAACSDEPSIATFKVEPITFTRRVTAEGTLKPVKATPVSVPVMDCA